MSRFAAILLVFALLGVACTPINYVSDKIEAEWHKKYGEPGDPNRYHIYNFDTFVCDGARQLVVSFNPNGTSASIMFEKNQLLMTRDVPVHPFTNPPYAMYIMADGTLLLEKHMDVLYKHCKPLVNDPVVAGQMIVEYDYTPTITPEEAKGDALFREQMRK